MFTLSQLILTGVLCAVIAAFAGWLFGRLGSGDQRRNRQMERDLQDTRAQLRDYQHEVATHFARTAQLIDELTESYRQVHNHIAEGANTLVEQRPGKPLMKTIPSMEQIEAISEQPETGEVSPPLDYAPRDATNHRGVLDESFGLDKEYAGDEGEPGEHPLTRHIAGQQGS